MQGAQPEGSKWDSYWHDVAPGSMVDLVVTLARRCRGVTLQSLLQDFILSQVTFSIINAAHTAAVLVQSCGVCPANYSICGKMWFVTRGHKPAFARYQSL